KRLVESSSLPKTSQPTPEDFKQAYGALFDAGCSDIVSIHLTSPLSGTYESALAGADSISDHPGSVRVVDTKLVSQGTGLVVKKAVEARDAGASASEIEALAHESSKQCQLFFILDTLEYLVKGGRAGKASGLAASVLNIKPVLTFNEEGTIEPFKKVKGLKKAMAELAAHVAEESKKHRLRVAFLSACRPDLSEELRRALEDAGADFTVDSDGLVGAVIGTYAGPGAVGCAFLPA
ncbi:MAG: DegV family protein, partial [Coriobacteriia bacterium]|nr:DegV family protein [Coriobacteriia bacterium]